MRAPKFIGVFSKSSSAARRPGSMASGSYYFVWQLANGSYAAQPLDRTFTPTGAPVAISASRLKAGYRLEPGLMAAPLSTPDFRGLKADQPPKQAATELNDDTLAKLERARKTKQVETDMRDSFSKALRALNRPRDRKGALVALEQLAAATENIVPEHKHMFRDFGVSLRKKSMPELALQCAKRAVELAPGDDHAHFNMARLLDILGLRDEALAHLRRAMKIDSREPVYGKFKAYMEAGGSSRNKD